MLHTAAESRYAPALRGRGFEPIPDEPTYFIRQLIEGHECKDKNGKGRPGGKTYCFLEFWGAKITIAFDEIGGIWKADGHADLKCIEFVEGFYDFQNRGHFLKN